MFENDNDDEELFPQEDDDLTDEEADFLQDELLSSLEEMLGEDEEDDFPDDDFSTDLENDFHSMMEEVFKSKNFHFEYEENPFGDDKQTYHENALRLFYSIPYYFYHTKVNYFAFQTHLPQEFAEYVVDVIYGNATLLEGCRHNFSKQIFLSLYFSFLAGLCIADQYDAKNSNLGHYVDDVAENCGLDGAELLRKNFSNTLVKDGDSGLGFALCLYKNWMKYMRPDWEKEDCGEYMKLGFNSAFQLGVSMMLIKRGYADEVA